VSPTKLSWNSAEEVCSICCDDAGPGAAVRLRCSHGWYCTSCVGRHVEARLDNGSVLQNCPQCQDEIAERDLKRLIRESVMNRLLKMSLEQAVAAASDLRPCPTPNCPMRVAMEPGDPSRFVCPECRKECCLKCGAQPFHRKKTCEQHVANQKKGKRCSIFQWMKETGSKQCPTCQMAVTKQNLEKQETQRSECHKMCCRNCNTRFCFKCLAILSKDYTCGCTQDEHGFIDPNTGKILVHLKKKRKSVKTTKAAAKASAGRGRGGRGRGAAAAGGGRGGRGRGRGR